MLLKMNIADTSNPRSAKLYPDSDEMLQCCWSLEMARGREGEKLHVGPHFS